MEVRGTLSIERDGTELLGGRRIALLAQIEAYGSITRAARAVGISYRAAWAEIDLLNNLAPVPLVERVAGGAGGGGTWLTPAGKELLARVRLLRDEQARLLQEIGRKLFADEGETCRLLRRIDMKLSARNQWYGQVSRLTPGAVNTVVEMTLKGGDLLTAVITRESAESLGLAVGSEALALVKASSVLIATDLSGTRLSARNQLAGTVCRLTEGPVSCEVTLELAGGSLVSATVTRDAAQALDLRSGQPAWAIIKSSSILLGIA